MASTSQPLANPSNWLDGDRVPFDIKFMILQYTSSHDDLLSLLEAYPEWVWDSWMQYPEQLFPRALNNILNTKHWLEEEAVIAYHVRNTRKQYAASMEDRHETQEDRERLESNLRDILEIFQPSMNLQDLPQWNKSLETILDFGRLMHDVYSLTYRYSNDAWKRIRDIAQKTGSMSASVTNSNKPPKIVLEDEERHSFYVGFLRVEIYLLTKYWTNDQGERHILDMGSSTVPFIPPADSEDRDQFDSCLRYIFNAYRTHLRQTARELNVPELPTRDDLPWVPSEFEGHEYEYPDYQPRPTVDPATKFAERSISEEQSFLLWLCEWGISPLERTHQSENEVRRDELLRAFSQRQAWGTVELRHRISRYDACIDQPSPCELKGVKKSDIPRNRHPVTSLYGQDLHTTYANVSSPWACASAFLEWSFDTKRYPRMREPRVRQDITLNERGRWITLSDTDRGISKWNAFQRKEQFGGAIPHGHPYMFSFDKYEFRSMPQRIWLIGP
ncbi:hypothetical protein diail_3287 [Diaporthe ilicicola]|nr:hypothetical protein diail_3287 [Diaporthe ilicicola]